MKVHFSMKEFQARGSFYLEEFFILKYCKRDYASKLFHKFLIKFHTFHTEEDLEDLTQNFMSTIYSTVGRGGVPKDNVFHKWCPGESKATFDSYLSRIIHNQAVNFGKRMISASKAIQSHQGKTYDTFDDSVVLDELVLLNSVREIDDKTSRTLSLENLYFMLKERMDAKDIAVKYNISVGCVRQQKTQLKKLFKDLYRRPSIEDRKEVVIDSTEIVMPIRTVPCMTKERLINFCENISCLDLSNIDFPVFCTI